MLWTIVGSVATVVAVVLLLVGSYKGNTANDKAHKDLGVQIHTEVGGLRTEMNAGFETISTLIDERIPAQNNPTKTQ